MTGGEHDDHDADLRELLRLDETAGPARRIDARRAHEMVDRAVGAWVAGAALADASPAAATTTTTTAAGAGGLKIALIAGGSAMVLATAIGAGVWVSRGAPERATLPEIEPAGELTLEPPPPPVTAERDDGPEAAPRPARPRAAEPEDLLEEGNRLRRAGAWRDAERAYLAASRGRPSSTTSHVADVAAASLRLEHQRDPRGAIRLYERALSARSDGPLGLEAREGIARSYRRLGRAGAERRALQELIRRHPDSRAAERARARLTEEGTP